MTEVDKQIESMGYEVKNANLSCCSMVYENRSINQEVVLEWDYENDEDCLIFSQTIAEGRDWYGTPYKIPVALTIHEAEVFVAKLKELKAES